MVWIHLVSCLCKTSRLDAMLVDASQSFGRLSSDERHHLREWQTSAMAIGIDAVEDFTFRPWPCPVAGSVIGVFTVGSTAARWLVVGEEGAWVVARSPEGDVSRMLNSLAEALAVIHPRQGDHHEGKRQRNTSPERRRA